MRDPPTCLCCPSVTGFVSASPKDPCSWTLCSPRLGNSPSSFPSPQCPHTLSNVCPDHGVQVRLRCQHHALRRKVGVGQGHGDAVGVRLPDGRSEWQRPRLISSRVRGPGPWLRVEHVADHRSALGYGCAWQFPHLEQGCGEAVIRRQIGNPLTGPARRGTAAASPF